MTVRMIHFFEDEDDGLGWSEVWYLGTTDISQGIQIAQSWAQYRKRILSIDSVISYVRVVGNLPTNNAPRPRQQRLAGLVHIGVQGTAQAGGARSGDLPWTAIKLRWQSADFSVFRTQLIRGLPDIWFDQGSDKIATAALADWLPGAIRQIQANGMQIRHLLPVVPPATARNYSYVAPGSCDYEGYTRRATGRPFGLPRGRRPNRT